jgi:5'-3' exonuclease
MVEHIESYHQIVVDAPFLTRRAFEAGGLRAMYGASLGTLLHLMDRYRPVDVYVAWEASVHATPRREQIWEDYKRNHKPALDEYYVGLLTLQEEILPHLGIMQAWPGVEQMGIAGGGTAPLCGEADDVAATLVRRDLAASTLLWTADKDWLQLVGGSDGSSCCHLLRPRVGKREEVLITPDNIIAETGFAADDWTSLLSLAGDAVDGIPGLPRVGHQRALDLLRACPTIVADIEAERYDEIRDQVAMADPSMGKWVEVAIDRCDLLRDSHQMVKLATVPIEVRYPRPNQAAARAWLEAHDLDLQDQLDRIEYVFVVDDMPF